MVRWTADRGRGGASPARGRWSSPELTGDGGGGRAGRGGAREVLIGDGGVAERRRTGGNERWHLELVATVKEGVKELGREGMRCSESRGSHRPFIGVGGCHTPFRERGNEASIRVPRMFKSHV
jgi:hypothetical protein